MFLKTSQKTLYVYIKLKLFYTQHFATVIRRDRRDTETGGRKTRSIAIQCPRSIEVLIIKAVRANRFCVLFIDDDDIIVIYIHV